MFPIAIEWGRIGSIGQALRLNWIRRGQYEELFMRMLMNAAAHTISQRLARLKRVPPELIPLGTLSH